MQALIRTRYGPPEVVQVADLPQPEPAANELLIRVRASAVNTGDWRVRAAAFPGVLAIPGRLMFGILAPRNHRLGTEFAGLVEDTGRQATRFAAGDRVYGMLPSGGATAQYLTIPATDAVAPIPPGLDFEQAAALPFGGLCALAFLKDFGSLKAEQKLLIVGASGGVGAYAVQVGKALGAAVTGVAGPDSQALLKSLGADATIDYRRTTVRDWPEGFDLVFDTVGALSPRHARGLLRDGGLFLPLNFGLRELGAVLLNPLRSSRIRLAVNEDTAEGLRQLSKLVEDGRLRPVIDSRYPMAEAARAHTQVESRHRQGSIVLTVP